MFEFVPILKGLYLTYSEYFAALIALVAFVVFIVFYLIGKLLYHFAKTTKNVQVSPYKVVKIQTFRDVTRAFGAIFTILATFFLLVSITSLGAFRVIPIWISALLNFITLFIGFLHTIVKITTREDFGIRRGYYHFRTSPHKNIYNIILIKLFLIALSVPVFFKGTCICLYEEHADLALSFDKLGLPASVNTELTRLFLIKNIFSDPEQPGHVYATLTDETSTQVFFNVQTHKSLTAPLTLIWTDGTTKGLVKSTPFTFEDLENRGQRVLHTFLLNSLKPNTLYNFTFDLGSTSHTYKYKTLKKQYTNSDPITIVSGGDVGNSQTAGYIWQQIALSNPDVIFIGGDLAYDNNNVDCYWTWDLFLSDIGQLNQNIGRVVPIILAIGNHDAGLNPFSQRSLPISDNLALPIFFSFFPQHLNHQQKIPRISERKPYFYQKLGQSIYFTLDSGYLTSYEEQAIYIDQILKLHPFTLHKFAQYHHPIYSSCEIKDYEVINYDQGRAYWIPVFDRHNFTTIYENHQHLHKRTQQLKNNEPNKQGTLYIGDGVWGADVNTCALNVNFQYFDNIQRVSTVWVTQLTPSAISHKAVGINGVIFDSVTI